MEDINIKVNLTGDGGNSVDQNINKTTESVKSLKQQFIDARKELMLMDETDPGFLKKAAEAGQLKDQIGDMNAVINATAGSTTENLGNALTGVASIGIGAFQGIASAQALFGSESEDLQKILVKLQAAASMADAIKSFGQFGDTLTQIKASIGAVYSTIVKTTVAKQADAVATTAQTTATTAQAAATEGATAAQAGLNATMLMNPIFLVIAAIGALTAAYYVFSNSAEESANSANELSDSIQKQGEAAKSASETIKALYNDLNAYFELLKDRSVIEAQDELTDILRKEPENYEKIINAVKKLNAAKLAAAQEEKTNAIAAFDLETNFMLKRREQIDTDFAVLNSMRSIGTAEEKEARKQQMADLQKERSEITKNLDLRSGQKLKLETEADNKILQIKLDNGNTLADWQKKWTDSEKKILEEKIAKEDAQWLRTQELTLSETEFKKLQLQQRYDEEMSQAEGNAELQKALTKKLQKDLDDIDAKVKEDNLKKEKEFIDKKKSLYESYYEFLDSLETDPVVKRLQQLDDEVSKFDEALANKLISQEKYNEEVKKRTEQAQADITEIYRKAAEDESEISKKKTEEEINRQIDKYRKINETAQYYLNGIQNLTELFQEISRNRLEEETENELSKYEEGTVEYENAKKRQLQLQEEAAKKAFNINKAFQLASAINDGTLAVLSTFAQTPGELIAKSAAAAVAGIFAAANIARIAASKYKGGSSSSSSPTSSLTSNVSSTPQINLFGNPNNANTVNASTNQPVNVNNQVTVKAYVSETDITDSQKRVARYRSSSEL